MEGPPVEFGLWQPQEYAMRIEEGHILKRGRAIDGAIDPADHQAQAGLAFIAANAIGQHAMANARVQQQQSQPDKAQQRHRQTQRIFQQPAPQRWARGDRRRIRRVFSHQKDCPSAT